jgi:hypothetical protein
MITALINLVIYLLIVGLILWLLIYIIDTIPLFAPFKQVARIVITVIGCIILILILASLLGEGGPVPRLVR